MSFDSHSIKVLVFDTNILYEKGDNGCNFNDFKFNKPFQNVVDQIEERDLTDYIQIAIPEVVWNEMYHQRIRLFKEKNNDLKKVLTNFQFPFFEYEFTDGDYEPYLNDRINKYNLKLENFSTKILKFPLPSSNRFDSIVQRAFMKKPPFEGQDKKSDKGFKDALIWESILEYKASNSNSEMCLYTKDGLFNEHLVSEYESCFNEKIELLKDEESVIKFMARIEKEINQLRRPILDSVELYSNLRALVTNDLIRKILFEIELSHHVGTTIYDLSSSDNFKIKNIVDISDAGSIEKTYYEVTIEANLTFSNGENGEDIDIVGQDIKLVFAFNGKENVFYASKIEILQNEYNIEKVLLEVS